MQDATRTSNGPWPSLYAGAMAGLLAQILVLRLNPELEIGWWTLLFGALLWSSWGVVLVGIPVGLVRWLIARIAGRRRAAPSIWPVAWVFALAGVLSWVNADLHPEFLSDGGRRQLYQDAVWWAVVVALIVVGHRVRRRWPGRWMVYLGLIAITIAPLLRILGAPTILGRPLQVEVEPLGRPHRPLVVIGIESLDANLLLGHATEHASPTLATVMESGAWGSLDPFRPNLEGAHWTTLATGTLPRRHGVKLQSGWSCPVLVDGTFRLLPWTPQGSRLFLPWDQGRRVAPPASTIPPLWRRLDESGVPSAALNWPGRWRQGEVRRPPYGPGPGQSGDAALARRLEAALLEADRSGREEILSAARIDAATVSEALRALDGGARNLWLRLRLVKTSRRQLEPSGPADIRRRRAMATVLSAMDDQLARLLARCPDDALIAVVSTTGMAVPDGWEAVLRFLGLGQDWRASAAGCPDGILVLKGRGVAAGGQFAGATLEDVVPTLCYLLDLPVSQYMEGRVILDAVDPAYLASRPLRVVH